MAWHQVLLLDVRSFSSHPINPGQHYLLQALDVGLFVESENMREDQRKPNANTTSDHSEHFEDWDFVFYHYRYILWGQSKPKVVLQVYYLIQVEIFLICEFVEKIYSAVFPHPSWLMKKICPFSFCMKNT